MKGLKLGAADDLVIPRVSLMEDEDYRREFDRLQKMTGELATVEGELRALRAAERAADDANARVASYMATGELATPDHDTAAAEAAALVGRREVIRAALSLQTAKLASLRDAVGARLRAGLKPVRLTILRGAIDAARNLAAWLDAEHRLYDELERADVPPGVCQKTKLAGELGVTRDKNSEITRLLSDAEKELKSLEGEK